MLLAVNGINTGIGFIYRDITNALVDKDQGGFYGRLAIYGAFLSLLFLFGLLRFISLQSWELFGGSGCLIVDWRLYENKAYYVLNPNSEDETDVDNPDQRITQDTESFTAQSLSLALGLFDALLTFFA